MGEKPSALPPFFPTLVSMKLRVPFFACFCCWVAGAWGQITFSPPGIHFSDVYQGSPISATITLHNPTATDLWVDDIDVYHTDVFSIQDTSFIVAAGGSRTLTITCDPAQNVNFADWLLVKSSTHPEVAHASLFAIGKYSDPYYDGTQNLWHEDLKAALKTRLTAGHVALSYNDARDKMYMIIDNQKVNGQGAAQNTIECVYTGYLAVGYADRQDAQNNYNLNTEHTMPQAFFNSQLPMYTDLHHLFVTTATSNSERGNNPFGIVANPSWSQGGSKSNGNVFEPRDQQKGASARALLYYLLRYQDYQNFICGMEPILRTWNSQFPPDTVDRKRNSDIYFYQHNRNPFVDHPELLSRIASLCSVNQGATAPIADWVGDTLLFGNVVAGNAVDGYYAVANHGRDTLHLTNLALNSPEFTLISGANLSIPKDSIGLILLRFTPTLAGQGYTAQLSFTTDDPTVPSRVVHLGGNGILTSVTEVSGGNGIQVWPQPARERVSILLPAPVRKQAAVEVWNLMGQQLRTTAIAKGERSCTVTLDGLPNGAYLLRMESEKGSFTHKLMVE